MMNNFFGGAGGRRRTAHRRAPHRPSPLSTQPLVIPTVDLSAHDCHVQIFDACMYSGFFYLKGHGMDPSMLDAILRMAKDFFIRTPDEEKEKIKRKSVAEGGDGARGYQRLSENVTQGVADYHEAIDWYKPVPAPIPYYKFNPETNRTEKQPPKYDFLMGQNLWPNEQMETAFTFYAGECQRVGRRILAAMSHILQVPDFFTRQTNESFWVMRAIGYPPLQNEADHSEGISCGEHTDYGCLTLLLQDSTRGALQVLGRDGTWVNAEPRPHEFVVNIGDMMEVWTNGIWRSTKHRVIHRAKSTGETDSPMRYRVSVPFFLEPNFDCRVEPLNHCKFEDDQEKKYDPVIYGEHLLKKATTNFSDSNGESVEELYQRIVGVLEGQRTLTALEETEGNKEPIDALLEGQEAKAANETAQVSE